ncbi:MAG TPA: PLDc N-terminal domain-containing protein [Gemmatimonadaceae bacterium]|jgi:phospholipase D-like protein|nr:PLDc N-terminal domain-containing protein [Gemmatimonadaceae bacterium]
MAIDAAAFDWRMPVLGWDMTRLAWVAVVAIVLLVLALVSIWHASGHSRSAKVVWTVVAVILPIIGPIAWAVAGRESRRTRANR